MSVWHSVILETAPPDTAEREALARVHYYGATYWGHPRWEDLPRRIQDLWRQYVAKVYG